MTGCGMTGWVGNPNAGPLGLLCPPVGGPRPVVQPGRPLQWEPIICHYARENDSDQLGRRVANCPLFVFGSQLSARARAWTPDPRPQYPRPARHLNPNRSCGLGGGLCSLTKISPRGPTAQNTTQHKAQNEKRTCDTCAPVPDVRPAGSGSSGQRACWLLVVGSCCCPSY
jgi:hypothetical protein